MRVCIATTRYYERHATFVNRHVAELFGGAACVITARQQAPDPTGRPVFVRDQLPRTLGDLATLPATLFRNRVVHATSRVPYGHRKKLLHAFLTESRVELAVAEFGTQALATAAVFEEFGVPLFSYFRGYDASKSLRNPRICDAYRRMMPRLAGIFSVSQFLLENLEAHGIRHPNSFVIPSGVDVSRFLPRRKIPHRCVAVGRFIEKKAPLLTLRAFADAARDQPEATLEMIGGGPLLARARMLAAELGLTQRVHFPGAMPHEYVREHLAEATCFLQHSLTDRSGNTEGLPSAIQEALAAGCIIVSTRHAGIPEAIEHGVNGYLVDEGDSRAYADHIRQVLTRNDLTGVALAARATAESRFDSRKLLLETERCIASSLRCVPGRTRVSTDAEARRPAETDHAAYRASPR